MHKFHRLKIRGDSVDFGPLQQLHILFIIILVDMTSANLVWSISPIMYEYIQLQTGHQWGTYILNEKTKG